jgi:hypothetical protein
VDGVGVAAPRDVFGEDVGGSFAKVTFPRVHGAHRIDDFAAGVLLQDVTAR